MRTIGILALLAVALFSPAFATTVCRTHTFYTGCTNAEDFGCEGDISNINYGTAGYTTAVCNVPGDAYCSNYGCSAGESVRRGTCGTFNVLVDKVGRYSTSEAKSVCDSLCPYWDSVFCSVAPVCSKSILFICYEWHSTGLSTCDVPACVPSASETTMSCQKEEKETRDCWEEEAGSCNQPGSFCHQGGVARCGSDGKILVVTPCEKYGLECYAKTSTYAVCVDTSERDIAVSCSPEGTKRCNPIDTNAIQICQNGEWLSEGTICQYGCNSTGVNDAGNECKNLNTAGACNVGDSLCVDTGADAFQFVCVASDWSLTKECPTDRCSLDSTSCWDGCEFLESMCYAENLSCYYCNEVGNWTFSGECVGAVDNITMQCLLDEVCTSGSLTCSGRWLLSCVNGEWRRIEDCSYGCSLGECSSEGSEIFTPIMENADLLVVILPPLGLFLASLASIAMIVAIPYGLKYRMLKWIRGSP